MHLYLYYVHASFLQCLPKPVLAVSADALGNLDNLHFFFLLGVMPIVTNWDKAFIDVVDE